jgi:hypothetical protein
MISEIFSTTKMAKKLAFLTQNAVKLRKNWIMELFFFRKNATFCLKIAKIAEISDRNIGLRG